MSDNEVTIVGAGPSGLVAALTLKRAGFNVNVKEARKEVGMRLNGDFQGFENWSRDEPATDFLKRVGVKTNFLFAPLKSLDVYSPSRKKQAFSSAEPFFYLVKRGTEEGCLDIGLKEQVLDSGVAIEFEKRVEKINGPTVIATGPKFAEVMAGGYTFNTDMEDMGAAILDDRLAAGGYSYFLVKDGKGTIATCFFSNFKQGNEMRERTVAAFQELYDFKMNDKKTFAGFGNVFFPKQYHTGQKYYVGESAGLQDYLWGFGMRTSMLSGFLAAQSIITGEDYDSSIQKQILPWVKASFSNRLSFSVFGNIGYSTFINNARVAGDPREFLHKLYKPSLWKTLGYPIERARAKLKFLDKSCNHQDCKCVWCKCGPLSDL